MPPITPPEPTPSISPRRETDAPLRVLLLSTYDLGRQPFGLASPAAWLREAGASVRCLDLSRQSLDEEETAAADLVAFHLPMHTATRLALPVAARVRERNPHAHLCFYGLYAPLNETLLRRLGGGATILGGEFEGGLLALVERLSRGHRAVPGETRQPEAVVSLEKLRFRVPCREGLPPLDAYAHLQVDPRTSRRVGYTEATRGCKHLCRHCPIVPVYGGRFRTVPLQIVLADVRAQVGRGAEHLTFGDPDFLNGPRHALAVVRACHDEFPSLTYDVTIKVEHLLRHRDLLPELRRTGCLFVTTAVESFDDRLLSLLRKGHTRSDVYQMARVCRDAGLLVQPTFLPFTPWTTVQGYRGLLDAVRELGWVEQVPSVQLAIRLLVTARSALLELPDLSGWTLPFDEEALVHPWRHPDPRMDVLQKRVEGLVREMTRRRAGRAAIFDRVRELAEEAEGRKRPPAGRASGTDEPQRARAAVPFLTEPWYC
jgi:radical SAM superfamily enzyme YgiQ (UPF0313 family)